MKYILFAGLGYYPIGGALDIKSTNPTIEDAKRSFEQLQKESGSIEWGHVFDVQAGDIVCTYHRDKWIDGK